MRLPGVTAGASITKRNAITDHGSPRVSSGEHSLTAPTGWRWPGPAGNSATLHHSRGVAIVGGVAEISLLVRARQAHNVSVSRTRVLRVQRGDTADMTELVLLGIAA